jgi:hypothetical protein
MSNNNKQESELGIAKIFFTTPPTQDVLNFDGRLRRTGLLQDKIYRDKCRSQMGNKHETMLEGTGRDEGTSETGGMSDAQKSNPKLRATVSASVRLAQLVMRSLAPYKACWVDGDN